MAELFTEEKIIQLKEARDKAMEDTTPFPVMKDGDLAVVGDANKTEVKKHDFVVTFVVPDENGVYQKRNVEYKDVYLKPRQAVTVQRLMTALQPLYSKIKPGGKVEDYTADEIRELAIAYEGTVLDQIYRLVAVVLGVDDELVDYMHPDSVMEAYHKIMQLYPDMVKAAESFFGLSSGKKTTNPSNNG